MNVSQEQFLTYLEDKIGSKMQLHDFETNHLKTTLSRVNNYCFNDKRLSEVCTEFDLMSCIFQQWKQLCLSKIEISLRLPGEVRKKVETSGLPPVDRCEELRHLFLEWEKKSGLIHDVLPQFVSLVRS